MSNLSEGLIQQGIQQGIQLGKMEGIQECTLSLTVDHVKNLIDFGLSLEDILKALKIDDATKQEVLAKLKDFKEDKEL